MEKNINQGQEKAQAKRFSYEELNDVANQLSMQLRQAQARIAQMDNTLVRLELLFKVVEFADRFNPDFVLACSNEIESLISLSGQEEKTEDKE